MTRNGRGEEVGTVNVHREQLAHALDGVVGRLKIFTKACAGDQVVNLAVLGQDVRNTLVDALRIGHICEMGSDLGGSVQEGILSA